MDSTFVTVERGTGTGGRALHGTRSRAYLAAAAKVVSARRAPEGGTLTAVDSTFVTVELPYPPLSGNSHTRGSGRGGARYMAPEARAYLAAAAKVVGARRAPEGLIDVELVLAPPDRRIRDADNARKVIFDALTRAGFWRDDSNRVIRRESCEWTDPVPGGRVLLTARSM